MVTLQGWWYRLFAEFRFAADNLQEGQRDRMVTTHAWEYGTRLGSIQNQSTMVFSSHAYAYDALNRRRKATLTNNSYWQYGYNDRNEVASGKHYWADGTPLPGQQFEYGYDNIGNRDYAYSGGNSVGGDLRMQDYTANDLNQYSSILTPGYEDILGIAAVPTTVTVNTAATTRKFEYFHSEIPLSNTNAPVWQQVSIQAGSVTTNGYLLFPPNQQNPTYDKDGNLTSDGLWTNRWDAENRLIAIESRSDVPEAGRAKLLARIGPTFLRSIQELANG